MADIYKIATLNISGLASQTRLAMLKDFMRKQEIDIFLQEVMQPMFDTFRGYAAYTNRNYQVGYGYPDERTYAAHKHSTTTDREGYGS